VYPLTPLEQRCWSNACGLPGNPTKVHIIPNRETGQIGGFEMNILEFKTSSVAFGPTMEEHVDDHLGDHFRNAPSLQITYLGNALQYVAMEPRKSVWCPWAVA